MCPNTPSICSSRTQLQLRLNNFIFKVMGFGTKRDVCAWALPLLYFLPFWQSIMHLQLGDILGTTNLLVVLREASSGRGCIPPLRSISRIVTSINDASMRTQNQLAYSSHYQFHYKYGLTFLWILLKGCQFFKGLLSSWWWLINTLILFH